VTSGSRPDRFGLIVAALGGLFVALATMLAVLLVSRDGGGTTTTAAAGTTAAETTLAPTTTTTTAGTTAATTTTALETTTTATTTTTTAPPFEGTLDDKRGAALGSPVGRLAGIRSADHPGFARVVFDFPDGGSPGYWVGYTDDTTLTVILTAMDTGNPYGFGIFDAAGSHVVGQGSILAVRDGGRGGGSGEWVFEIILTGQKPFLVAVLDGPPRIYVDVGD
jgi:hypothetical protein